MTVLAVALVLGYLVWLTPQLLRRLDRYQDLLAQRAVVPDPTPHTDPIPVDLLLQAREAYAEKWAQDQAVESMVDLRGTLGSWDAVRTALAKGGL